MIRIITIKNCRECPHSRHDNGGGYCEPFIMCDKFNIPLDDFDYNKKYDNWNYHSSRTVHPRCRLDIVNEQI
jgi:hypothetical protein